MNAEVKLAENYRLRARELRSFAEKQSTTRDTLLKIAQDYEEAARLMESTGRPVT